MLIARFCIEAQFGHKNEALTAMKRWHAEVGELAGMKRGDVRLLTGSVGASESCIQMEWRVPTLAALESVWEAMAKNPQHAALAKQLQPFVVSGSNRWEILHVSDF